MLMARCLALGSLGGTLGGLLIGCGIAAGVFKLAAAGVLVAAGAWFLIYLEAGR